MKCTIPLPRLAASRPIAMCKCIRARTAPIHGLPEFGVSWIRATGCASVCRIPASEAGFNRRSDLEWPVMANAGGNPNAHGTRVAPAHHACAEARTSAGVVRSLDVGSGEGKEGPISHKSGVYIRRSSSGPS